jgi:hypothetical protein
MRECRLECSRRSAAVILQEMGPEESKFERGGGTGISNDDVADVEPGVNGRKTSASWSSISGFSKCWSSRNTTLRSVSACTLAACWAASMLALFGESGMESGARSLDRLRAWPTPLNVFPVATTSSFSDSEIPFRRGDVDAAELRELEDALERRSGWSELAEDGKDDDSDGGEPPGGEPMSVSHSRTRDLTLHRSRGS